MKRMLGYFSFSVIMIMAVTTANAQRLQASLGYQIAVPTGDFSNLVGNTSFRGFNAAIMYPINDQFNVGLGVSFNDFMQKYGRQVYSTTEGDISAVVTNSVQVTPIVAKASYSFLTSGLVRPYIGAGAGVNFISYSQYLGQFPDNKSAFKPAVVGDAGVNIPLGRAKNAGINVGATYNYLPFNYNDVKNLNNWGIHAGAFFSLR
jgi:outer membrane protein W